MWFRLKIGLIFQNSKQFNCIGPSKFILINYLYIKLLGYKNFEWSFSIFGQKILKTLISGSSVLLSLKRKRGSQSTPSWDLYFLTIDFVKIRLHTVE